MDQVKCARNPQNPSQIVLNCDCWVSILAHPTSIVCRRREDSVKKTFINARNIVGIAGLLLAGYLIVTSLPDMGRYIRISNM
jgi:hypothetical protein